MKSMAAVAAYTFDRCLRTQLWWPVILVYLLVVAFAYPFGEPMLQTGSVGALLLTPVAAWLVVATLNSESVSQNDVLVVSAGSYTRTRAAVWLTAVAVVFLLSLTSVGLAAVRDHSWTADTPGQAALVFCIHLVAGLPGAAIGLVAARPVIVRPAFSILLAGLLSLCVLILPASPLRTLVSLANESHYETSMLGPASAVVALTAALSLGAAWAAMAIASRRN